MRTIKRHIISKIPALVWVSAFVAALFYGDWRIILVGMVLLPITVCVDLVLEAR